MYLFQNFWYKNIISGVLIGLIFAVVMYDESKGMDFALANFFVLSAMATIFSMGWDLLLNRNKR